jgi:Protein of unknown function (DUF2892)
MNPLVMFMASATGRIIRIVAGITLIVWGQVIGGTNSIIIMSIGLLPLLSGLFDFCVFALLVGFPLSGSKIRAKK